jgi:CubicO group peptidase (beta-lactamase class C family)
MRAWRSIAQCVRRLATIALVAAVVHPWSLAAQRPDALPDSVAAAIDRLFAPMGHSGSPGCAAGVFRNGSVVFARGYGFADLAHDVPITPATRFTVGSVSKQFTAATIALLAQAGRISLDDDVRKYVP